MVYFCESCTKTHKREELCPYIKEQLKNDPKLISEASATQQLNVYKHTSMWYHVIEVMLHGKNHDNINVGTAERVGEVQQ